MISVLPPGAKAMRIRVGFAGYASAAAAAGEGRIRMASASIAPKTPISRDLMPDTGFSFCMASLLSWE